MSRRVDKATAFALLEGYARAELGDAKNVSPRMLGRAMKTAESMLNRAARRALGERGSGIYHPLGRPRAVPGNRPALKTRRAR